MKNIVLIFAIVLTQMYCANRPPNIDCTKLQGFETDLEFDVRFLSLGDSRYSEYVRNESKYTGNQINLSADQIGDTLVVNFIRLGGNFDLKCVTINRGADQLDIINHETNFLKDITLREFEYKIFNKEKLKLGAVIDKHIK